MNPITLPVQPLTSAAFAPYGEVIAVDGADSFPINQGRTQRFHALARVTLFGKDASVILSIFRGRPLVPPSLDHMERHPLGSQAFMPMTSSPYWVIVAPPGSFDPEAIQAFLARGNQGVNYFAGTWHAPLLPCSPDADFLVVDRDGAGKNCDVVQLVPPRIWS
jgi:ureidoglycolate lyase